MAIFKPSIQVSFDVTGTIATFTDTSNYSVSNPVTLGNVLSRTVTVKDGNTNTIATLVFTALATTITLAVTKDYYLNLNLDWQLADNSHVLNTINYLSTQIYDLAALSLSANTDCGCVSSASITNDLKANKCRQRAVTAFQFGYAPKAQVLIDAANALIS